ncbi:MAG: orotidine-5'-phosphate decarboxylase [Ferrovibrionaceae bacterium]
MTASIPVFVAVDTVDLDQARRAVAAAAAAGMGVKLGLEIFNAHGPAALRPLVPSGVPLFLDLKCHDIPNTVAGAVRGAVGAMRPDFLTIHASGGRAMVEAAVANAGDTRILAVTVLTSLDQDDLAAAGVAGTVEDQVARLAALARGAGADGLVCAATEIAVLKARLGRDTLLVVPGIRPAGSAAGDQKRMMTPRDALAAGADWLVIGRPITGAPDPAAAARAIARDILAAEIGR